MTELVEQVAQLLVDSRNPIVLTGAGMSAESGVPTFRDAQTGHWSRFDPNELATPEAFRRRPDVVFGWYAERLRTISSIRPHPGYGALVQLEHLLGSLPIVTQNVDGLHAMAGSTDVVELHGSLRTFRCVDAGHEYPFEAVLGMGHGDLNGRLRPPECMVCGDLVRPGVVWFGEVLPQQALARAEELVTDCDLLLLVGTSAVVYPAAALPFRAKAMGSKVIEVNPDSTPFTNHADIAFREAAGDALAKIVNLVTTLKAA